ncbi:MAG: dihydrodipicolinate synthase family protein [Thermoleophilia bacterium]|nr:dihydrodipicolinate synthase family protein [Thermoleophilia bacterium]
MVRGAIPAALTPLRGDGEALDEEAFAPYVEFLAGAGLDAIFALGTTGEGILLRGEERRRAGELFAAACARRVPLVLHCGAQSTSETVALCEHAASLGVAGIAVVAPPYYAFDERALLHHFSAAARACAPTPFYLYEFEARSGYAIPLSVVERLVEEAPNLRGAKVSDAPWDKVAPYLVGELDVFVGAEALIPTALAAGAAGAVSGLASAFPEPVVALVRDPGEETLATVRGLREALPRFPFVAAAKRVLARRGLPVREACRAPMRALTADERALVDRVVAGWADGVSSEDRASPPVAPRA